MSSIQLFSKANQRQRRSRTIQVAVVVFVATVMAMVSLGILLRLDAPLEAMAQHTQSSHLSLQIDTRRYDPVELQGWFADRPETAAVYTYPMVNIEGMSKYLKAGQSTEAKIEHSLFLAEYDPGRPADHLELISGQVPAALGPKQVWVPNSLASIYKWQVGDTLRLMSSSGYQDFAIAAIIIDPQYSPLAITNLYRLWVGQGELAWHFSAARLNYSGLQVRLKDPTSNQAVQSAFLDSVPGGYGDYILSWDSVKSSYGFIFRIIAIALFGISIITLLIAIFVIYTTISGAILADAKVIGVLKALGFTPRNIVASYTLQNVQTAVFGALPAIVIAWFLTELLSSSFMSAVSVVQSGGAYIGLCAIVLPSELLLLALCAVWFARRAGRLRSVEALRMGEAALSRLQVSRHRLGRSSLWPVEWVIAFKQLLATRRRALFLGITGFLAAFMLVFSLSFYTFMQSTGNDLAFWGFPNADVQISLPPVSDLETSDYLQRVTTNPRLARCLPTAWAYIGFPAIAHKQIRSRQIFCDLADGDFDQLGFSMLEGKNPQTAQQVALAFPVAQLYGVSVGETITLTVVGQALNFKVSGIYQSTNQMGQSCRLSFAGYQRSDPNLRPSALQIWLRSPTEAGAFKAEMAARYGSAMPVILNDQYYRGAIQNYVGSSSGVMVLILLIVIIACAAVIQSDTAIEIESGIKTFGLLKTLGYTPQQLRFIVAWKNSLIMMVAALLGSIVALLVQTPLIAMPLSALGIAQVTIQPNFLLVLTVILVLGFVSGIFSWIAARSIRSLSVRSLIVE